MPQTEVVVVGAGQAGLMVSYLLTKQGRPHIVLEQERIAESWRTRRWDSLRLVAPNWSLQFIGYGYTGDHPDQFMGKDEVAAHLEAYAHSFRAPVQAGVRVCRIDRAPDDAGFIVETEGDRYAATQVVLATGALQKPRVPTLAEHFPASICQVVPYQYRNPAQLPPGNVLIVGSGQSGCQIAEELLRAGREVHLAVSRSWWLPRRYRGQDISAWVRALGVYQRTVDELPPGKKAGEPNPQLSGSDGGHDISTHMLARLGVHLYGRLQGVRDGRAFFGDDLAANVAWGDDRARTFLTAVDDHVRAQGLTAPSEEWPRDLTTAAPPNASATELDSAKAGISTVIWATGYRPDWAWVGLPFLDADGYPIQRRGVTNVPGLFMLGMDWLHSAGSGLFAGVGSDAEYLVAQMSEARPLCGGAERNS